MRAFTVQPGTADSARLDDVPDPPPEAGSVLVRTRVDVDVDALNRTMVLENDVIFGSVNANRRHYELAAHVLAPADTDWLSRLISRRIPVERWSDAFNRRPDDVKVILDFSV